MPYPTSSSTSNQPLANPVSVIGPHFCAPYPVDLLITGKVLSVTGKFFVTDINGNILFQVKEKSVSLRGRQVLLDRAGNPIVTLKQKAMSLHDRCQVFKGDSTDASDLLFSVRRPAMFQLRSKLDVFLANNTMEEVCDFTVKESWLGRSCVIYAGESSAIVAQKHEKQTVDKSMVTVYPNIDYAFIAALFMIVDALEYTGGGGGGGE
ncbi:hypothetical protein like AT5G01750 [Hibiscus trionum]|uniref:Protein LURP-one-related 15 n=1 Tax=Hibiscus trionum TaxID=183268 RepID=A0A9W7I7E8_HIBTR|nr:hypothetical protein like AT5G01750 [Hibiscus trionum]